MIGWKTGLLGTFQFWAQTAAFFLISSSIVKIGTTFTSNLGKLCHLVLTEFTFCIALSAEKRHFSIKIYIAM